MLLQRPTLVWERRQAPGNQDFQDAEIVIAVEVEAVDVEVLAAEEMSAARNSHKN